MIAGRGLFFISVIIHIPINFHPWRRSFFNLIFGPKQSIEWKRSVTITLCALTVATLVAIVFPKIVSVIDIIGGYCGTILQFIIPTTVFLSVMNVARWKFILYIVMSIFLGVIGFYSATHTLISEINGNEK